MTPFGTEATAVLLLDKVTFRPFAGAAEPSVTVMVPKLVALRFKGFGDKAILFGAGAMLTV